MARPKHGGLATWETAAWLGDDTHKLQGRAKGEYNGSRFESAEFWGFYSRPVSDFWDAAVGYRFDLAPRPQHHAVLGVTGMLPLFIETEAFLFIGSHGDVTARLEHRLELPVTQDFHLEPHLEFNFAAQNSGRHHYSSGLVTAEMGLQLRYDITRKFAPYLDLNYERSAGATADHAREEGDNAGAFTARLGVKFWF